MHGPSDQRHIAYIVVDRTLGSSNRRCECVEYLPQVGLGLQITISVRKVCGAGDIQEQKDSLLPGGTMIAAEKQADEQARPYKVAYPEDERHDGGYAYRIQ